MKEEIRHLEHKLKSFPVREISREKIDVLNQLCRLILIEDPRRGLKLSTQAERLARKIDYREGLGYSIGLNGYSYYMMSNHEKALPKLKTALKIAEQTGFTQGQAEIYSGLAATQLSMGNYEDALANEFKALKIIKKIGNRSMEAWAYYNLGTGYHEWGDFAKALQFHRKSLKLFKDLSSNQDRVAELGYARALTGIGSAYQRMKKYQKALAFHRQSLKIFQKHHNKIGESRALNDLGTAYHNLGKFKDALQVHQKSLKIREKIGNVQSQCTSLINLGNLYIEQGESEKAQKVLEQALSLARKIKAKPRIFQASRALSEAYQLQGKFKQALTHYQHFHDVKEEVTGDEANARLKNLQISYETEQSEKEAEIERLKNVELKEKNDQLKDLLKELQETQSQLIQSEKMAALGNLIAGVVHEINSPIGALNSSTDLAIRGMQHLKTLWESHQHSSDVSRDQKTSKILMNLEDNIRIMVSAKGNSRRPGASGAVAALGAAPAVGHGARAFG